MTHRERRQPIVMPDHFDTRSAHHERLLARVLLGEDDAAQQLVGELAPVIRRMAGAVARGRHRHLREDLIQEVWAKLWSGNCRVLQGWDKRGPLVNYVWVVAMNFMRDLLRHVPVTESLDGLPEPPDAGDLEQMVEVEQLAGCLAKAKLRLSPNHRRLIQLRHEEDLTHQEIADRLNSTKGYVGPTLSRAERRLRDEVLIVCADHLIRFRSFLE
jgi:RNA polymerase sigma-70 factor (ECF subfamily)